MTIGTRGVSGCAEAGRAKVAAAGDGSLAAMGARHFVLPQYITIRLTSF